MWRLRSTAIALSAAATLAGCGHSAFAVRPLPRIVAENLGKPVSRLQDTFGEPRKIEVMPTKLVYVWFIPQAPAGAPQGFHGCEMEVTVDARSTYVALSRAKHGAALYTDSRDGLAAAIAGRSGESMTALSVSASSKSSAQKGAELGL